MLAILLAILCILAFLHLFSKQKDSFTCTYNKAFDKQHVEMYDFLLYDAIKQDQEMVFLDPLLDTSSMVLDVGCGKGHHVHDLQKRGIQAMGIDTSESMIKACKKYPYDFLIGDAQNTSLFSVDTFTHILCMYYTIYYMKNKKSFFENAHLWSRYLVIHMADEWKYGRKINGWSSSRYYDKYHEFFTNKGQRKRIEHKIYWESISSLIGMAKQAGFVVHSIYAYPMPYQGEYLYIFEKI